MADAAPTSSTIDPGLAVRVVGLLNQVFALDRRTAMHLAETRFQCNQAVADHPSVQVGVVGDPERGAIYQVGILGILNGLVGTDEEGWGVIAADYRGDELVGFKLLEERMPT